MEQTIAIKEKKEFIRWFLKKHSTKRRETVWILNYLLSHDNLLEKVHFVDDIQDCPNAMVMTANGVEGAPFSFHKGEVNNTDAEKAFHDLRLSPKEERYIQLNFPRASISTEYLSAVEVNPFMVSRVNEKDVKIAEELIEHLMKMSYQNNLNKMIDEALDNGDKELFMQLTSQMVKV